MGADRDLLKAREGGFQLILFCEEKCGGVLIAEIAQNRGLSVSGGSDYHGENKSVRLGALNEEDEGVEPGRLTLLSTCGVNLST